MRFMARIKLAQATQSAGKGDGAESKTDEGGNFGELLGAGYTR